MLKERPAEAAIIYWSGVLMLAGLILILLQLCVEAYLVHAAVVRQIGSSFIGFFVLIVGAALMAVAFVAGRLRPTPKGHESGK